MAPTKRLNLNNAQDNGSSTASSSSEDEGEHTVHQQESEESQSEDESDDEFEIPPGFESVKGSSAITRETVLSEDKELWLFKLPKHMDASALANISFKVDKKVTPGDVVTHITRDEKKYQLQHEDALLTNQLVNAFPTASDRKKFALAKPFARCFSLVEDRTSSPTELKKREVAKEPAASKEKTKHRSSSEKDRSQSKHKKAKHKK